MVSVLQLLGVCAIVGSCLVALALCRAAGRADAWKESMDYASLQDMTMQHMPGDMLHQAAPRPTKAHTELAH